MEEKEKLNEITGDSAAENTDYAQEIDVLVGDSVITASRPDPDSRHRLHWEMYILRRRRFRRLGVILAVLVILASFAWYFYSPIYGYGDLSENISSDMISRARSRFTVEAYNDKKEGVTLTYNIYIPFEYERTKHYPLMFCIADSASVGLDTEKPLRENFGGAVWATDSEQAKHPCFVVVASYPEKVTGRGVGVFTRYTDLTARMIDAIVRKYNINASEVHATGQGMGASMLIYLAAEDPDRFASLLLVDGGVEVAERANLSTSRFIYVCAADDRDARDAQQLLQSKLSSHGVDFSELTELDAEAPIDKLNTAVRGMLKQDRDRNFITWSKGSVGLSLFIGEQRAAYRYGYRSDAIRDWIMEESDVFKII